MFISKKELGKLGEETAANYLRKKGYRIIFRNFSCPLGEIDLIAEDKTHLVFVEVRTRRGYSFGLPEESVDWRKQKKLRRLAGYFLSCYNINNKSCRFDVIAIQVNKEAGIIQEIRHITSAF
ncbi:MAG: YraN family protein [Firmicutes bacterium]|nr:YraN family protein [Bacillota bacterium]